MALTKEQIAALLSIKTLQSGSSWKIQEHQQKILTFLKKYEKYGLPLTLIIFFLGIPLLPPLANMTDTIFIKFSLKIYV